MQVLPVLRFRRGLHGVKAQVPVLADIHSLRHAWQDGLVSLEEWIHHLRTAPTAPAAQNPPLQPPRPREPPNLPRRTPAGEATSAPTTRGGPASSMTKDEILLAARRTLPVGSIMRHHMTTLEITNQILSAPHEFARRNAGTCRTGSSERCILVRRAQARGRRFHVECHLVDKIRWLGRSDNSG